MIRSDVCLFAIGLLLSTNSVAGGRSAENPKFTSYCLTIELDRRDHDRVSVLNAVLKNATIIAVPRYPPGWQFDIKQEVEGDTVIFGAALAGVAQLDPSQLKCLVMVQNSFVDKQAILSGTGTISFGIEPQTQIVLRPDQFRFDKVRMESYSPK